MKKSALLVIFSLMLGSLFLFKPINSASAQSTQPEYNPNPFCSFTPNGAATGNVTLANSCVIYEDINGVANGNLTVNPNTSVTLHHNLVFYPGYKITVSPGAKIFVNSDSKIQQGVICIKKGASGYPVVKTVTGNVESGTGASVTSSALAQMDAVYAANSAACNTANGYYPRESFTSLAYVDTGLGATSFSTSDADMLGLGFTINGVTSTLAAAGDIQVDPAKNLILLPGGAGGKLGIGSTTPAARFTLTSPSTAKSDGLGLRSADVWTSIYNLPTTNRTAIDVTSGGTETAIGATGYPLILNPSQGSVGIGITSPSQKLDVNGAALLEGGGPLYLLDTNHGIKSTAGQGVTIFTYGVPNGIFLQQSTGNVGIGVTNPGNDLDVNGGIWTQTAGSARQVSYDLGALHIGAGNSIYSYGSMCTGNASGYCTGASGVVIGAANTSAAVNITNSGNTFFNGGNVGIGLNSPNGKLNIDSGTGDGIVFGQVNGDNTDSIQSYIDGQWAARATYASGCCNMLYIQKDAGDLSLGNAARTIYNYGHLNFSLTSDVAYPMVINSTVGSALTSGVQINALSSGTTSYYSYALDVNNYDNGIFNRTINASYKGTNASWSSAIYATNGANGSGAFGVIGYTQYGTAGWFQTSTGTALRLDGKMTINSGEIQSTYANQMRLVQGNYGLIFRQDGSSFYMLPTNSGDPYGGWNNRRPFTVDMNTGQVKLAGTAGQSNVMIYSSGDAYTGGVSTDWPVGWGGGLATWDINAQGIRYGSLQARSDARLKRDINPLSSDSTLSNVMKLKPVSFYWKDTSHGNNVKFGFIAQDMEKIYPNLVEKASDGILSFDYTGLIAPVVSTVQTQQKEIDDLKQEVQDLKKAIIELQNKSK